jgi:hypothetical protein
MNTDGRNKLFIPSQAHQKIEKALMANKKAWDNFNNLAPQPLKTVCGLVNTG